MYPSKHEGAKILTHLIEHASDCQVKPQKLNLKDKPTEAELIEDVMQHNGPFINQLSTEYPPEASWIDFWKGWGAMRDCGNPLTSSYIPYTTLGIVSYKSGTSKCIEAKPEILARKEVCIKEDHRKLILYGVYTPCSTITPRHLDSTGSGHIVLLLYGIKVVIWWESKPELLDFYEQVHCQRKGVLSLNPIKTWPSLKWSILQEPGHYLHMNPGEVHLVLSPINPAVTG